MTRVTIRTYEEINRWHQGMGQISQAWVEWLPDNAEKYPTYAAAWQEFKAQLDRELGLSLRERAIANALLFE